MAALSTIAALATITAAGASTYSALTQKKPAPPPAAPPLPTAPQRDLLGETEAVTRARKRKMGSSRASSIKSGPSGTTAAAPTERSTLLGS